MPQLVLLQNQTDCEQRCSWPPEKRKNITPSIPSPLVYFRQFSSQVTFWKKKKRRKEWHKAYYYPLWRAWRSQSSSSSLPTQVSLSASPSMFIRGGTEKARQDRLLCLSCSGVSQLRDTRETRTVWESCLSLTSATHQIPRSHSLTHPPAGLGRESEG